jgi:hypothetical protein
MAVNLPKNQTNKWLALAHYKRESSINLLAPNEHTRGKEKIILYAITRENVLTLATVALGHENPEFVKLCKACAIAYNEGNSIELEEDDIRLFERMSKQVRNDAFDALVFDMRQKMTDARRNAYELIRKKLDEISSLYYEAVVDCDLHRCSVGSELSLLVNRIDDFVDIYGEDC